MSLTFAQASDEILALFRTAWGDRPALYENVRGSPPRRPIPWARVTLRHITGAQASLAGGSGTRRWERVGILTVQIFVPSGQGLAGAQSLAKIAVDAYQGQTTPGGVWFRNVRLTEVGPDGDWFQVNALAEFVYDEIQ